MNEILCIWYLFGCFMMGRACRSVYDENKKTSIISVIGLLGIMVYVAYLTNLN